MAIVFPLSCNVVFECDGLILTWIGEQSLSSSTISVAHFNAASRAKSLAERLRCLCGGISKHSTPNSQLGLPQ
jgi:hypothetical protein